MSPVGHASPRGEWSHEAGGELPGAVSVMVGKDHVYEEPVNTRPSLFMPPVCRVEVSYQRMEDPGCHVVDASPSREKVLQTVLSIIQNNCNVL